MCYRRSREEEVLKGAQQTVTNIFIHLFYPIWCCRNSYVNQHYHFAAAVSYTLCRSLHITFYHNQFSFQEKNHITENKLKKIPLSGYLYLTKTTIWFMISIVLLSIRQCVLPEALEIFPKRQRNPESRVVFNREF